MTQSDLPLRIFRGQTVHQRSVPFGHRFQYALAMIDIDIDHLETASQHSSVFSTERANLFYFLAKDHGARGANSLRAWAEQGFKSAGIELAGGKIRLLTFPRHLFYKFAPISLWLGYDQNGIPRGVIYEVNNTFGESHTYIAAILRRSAASTRPQRCFTSRHFLMSRGNINSRCGSARRG